MWPSSVSTKIEGRIHLIDFSAANCAPSPYDMSVGSKYESFCNFNTGNDKDLACFPVATPTPSSYMLIRASMILLHQSKLRRKEVWSEWLNWCVRDEGSESMCVYKICMSILSLLTYLYRLHACRYIMYVIFCVHTLAHASWEWLVDVCNQAHKCMRI